MNTTETRIDLEQGAYWEGLIVFEYDDSNYFINCNASNPVSAWGSGDSYGAAYRSMIHDITNQLNRLVRSGENLTGTKIKIVYPQKPPEADPLDWEMKKIFPDATRSEFGDDPTWVVDLGTIIRPDGVWRFVDKDMASGDGMALREALRNYAESRQSSADKLSAAAAKLRDAAEAMRRLIGEGR